MTIKMKRKKKQQLQHCFGCASIQMRITLAHIQCLVCFCVFFFFISSNWQSIWQFSRYFCRRWVVTTTHKSILIPLSTIFECRLLFASILFRYHFNSIWISARQIARASCKITNNNTIKYVCIFSIFEKPIYIILCIGSCFFIIFVALQCFW